MNLRVFDSNPLQSLLSVVLVEPGNNLNIGSVARAMSNLGIQDLRLVNPPRYERSAAEVSACWGKPVLEQAQIFGSLEEALCDRQDAIGFSNRAGKNRARPVALADYCQNFLNSRRRSTALVFGPEDTGLRHEHTALCRLLVYIPGSAQNSSYNLSQAVLLALYELSKTAIELPCEGAQELPELQLFSQLDRLVDQVLHQSGFYNQGTPQQLPELIQHLWRRLEPDQREMQILLGMFSKISKALNGEIPVQSLPARPQ